MFSTKKQNTMKPVPQQTLSYELKTDFKRNKYLYLLILPVIAYYLIFHYWPYYGLQIAFKSYSPGLGFLKSPWVGFKHFTNFFNSYFFVRTMRNTLLINIYQLIFGFTTPIIFALLLNEVRNLTYKKYVQTVSYIPNFIAMVVICGMIKDFTASDGLINQITALFGMRTIPYLSRPQYFRSIYIISDIWKDCGWSSIIYVAAISAIDPMLYQSAVIDGANRWKQMWHITLPGIRPTVTILLILKIGHLFSLGFEKIILLYSPAIYETADVVSSYVYRKGLNELNYSASAAVGLFNSVMNFALLILANTVSRKVSENSLW